MEMGVAWELDLYGDSDVLHLMDHSEAKQRVYAGAETGAGGGKTMNPFDMQMTAFAGLLFLLVGFSAFIGKEMLYGSAGLVLVLTVVWGEDICSREERMAHYTTHFDGGGELVCKADHSAPFLISQERGWERKGEYLFRGEQGIALTGEPCEIVNKSEPRCIPITAQIALAGAAVIWILGWMLVGMRRLRTPDPKAKAHDIQEHENEDDAKR